MKGKAFLLIVGLFFWGISIRADVVYLTNGRKIEGVVEKEVGKEIIVYIGSGRIKLKREDVERIEKYTPLEQRQLEKEWAYKYFSHPDFVPASLKDIAQMFEELEKARRIASSSKKQKDKYQQELAVIEEKIAALKKTSVQLNREISRINPEDDIEKYNSLIDQNNKLSSQIRLYGYDKENIEKKIKYLNRDIRMYINQLNVFRKELMQRYSNMQKAGIDEKARIFFEVAKEKIEDMEKDFSKNEVSYNKFGSSIVVTAELNNLIKARLILDTGASLVVISKDVADKLGIDIKDVPYSLKVVLADGRRVKAKAITLKSVKVGSAEVKNVDAAVLENAQPTDEDGLLGMSFLKNFTVKLDTTHNILIFEQFNP